MQEMFRIAGLVVCAAVVVDLLKHYNSGYAILAALACCIAILVGTAHLLAPVKSVTAVIGLARTPGKCHAGGCATCSKTDCAFRR